MKNQFLAHPRHSFRITTLWSPSVPKMSGIEAVWRLRRPYNSYSFKPIRLRRHPIKVGSRLNENSNIDSLDEPWTVFLYFVLFSTNCAPAAHKNQKWNLAHVFKPVQRALPPSWSDCAPAESSRQLKKRINWFWREQNRMTRNEDQNSGKVAVLVTLCL